MKIVVLAFLTVGASLLLGGLAFADVKWALDGGVTTGYDSNISYVNSKPIGDMVTHVALNGGLAQLGKNDQFDIKMGLLENIYTSHSSFDNLAENLSADYKADLNPFEHLKASDTFTHSVDPSSLENSFGRINGSYDTYYNNLALESKTDITEQWKGIFKYNQTDYMFSTQSLSDSAEYNPGISTEYDFSSQSQATLNYDYRRSTFSPGRSSDASTPSAGWRQYLDTLWYLDFLAGADFIKGFGQDLVKPRYSAGITNDVDKNTQLKLNYSKQYETDAFTQDILNDWKVVFNASHQITTRLNGDIAVFIGQGKYVGSGISNKFIGTNVSLKYAVNEHVDITLTYGLQNSNSSTSIRSSTSDTVFAGFTFRF